MNPSNLSTSNFKLFLQKIVLPVVGSIFLLAILFNYFFEQKIILGSEISGAYKVNRMINAINKEEIPIIGSSRAEGSYIPDSLVKNGFNYGMDGTQDNVSLLLLQEECKKNKTTPIIINFELDGFDYDLGDESNYIYNSDNPAVKELMGSTYKTIYRVPFLKYFGKFEIYAKYYMNSKINLTKFTNKGASIEKNEISQNKFNELVQQRANEVWTFSNDKKLSDEYHHLLTTNKNRKFIFVISPYHPSCFQSMKNYQEAENFLSSLRAMNNVLVFDFSKVVYPDNYFLNTTHLNLKGAIAFNKVLRDSLQKNGIR